MSQGTYPIKRIDIFFAGRYITTKNMSSFSYSFNPREYSNEKSGTLKIVVIDSVYNKTELLQTIKIQ